METDDHNNKKDPNKKKNYFDLPIIDKNIASFIVGFYYWLWTVSSV